MKSLFFIGVAVCLLASGCDSKNPLSDPLKSKADERLVGIWQGRGDDGGVFDDGEWFYHVGHAGDNFPACMMRVVMIQHQKGGVEPPGELLMFPSVLGRKTYLNIVVGLDNKLVKSLDEKGWKAADVDSYQLYKYQLDGDTLVLYGMDNGAKKKAINSGKIKGTEGNGSYRLTDTTENLARFIAEAGDDLWNMRKPTKLQRVRLEGKKVADKRESFQFLFPEEVERAMMMDCMEPIHNR